jgi:hypothetical protein
VGVARPDSRYARCCAARYAVILSSRYTIEVGEIPWRKAFRLVAFCDCDLRRGPLANP